MSARSGRRCETCGEQIWHLRRQAKYCGPACRKEAYLDRKRSSRAHGTVLDPEDGYFEALDAKRGYLDDWRPQRKTQVMLSRVQQVLAEYADHLPLTCRQIYYRMVAAWGYPKGKSFQGSLYGLLENARRADEIPFSSIRDDGILGGGSWWQSVREFREHQRLQARHYQRDLQVGQGVRLQVWCEAAGMIPQLTRICDPYSIPVYSCGGFNSLTAVRQIVDSCIEDTAGPTVILHLGDCDPSGYSVFQAVYEDAAAFVEADRWYETQRFDAERVALTFEQLQRFELEGDELTTDDSRSRVWRERGIHTKVEIEALPPNELANLLTEAIGKHVDDGAREEALRRQAMERVLVWMPDRKSLPSGISFERLLSNIARSNNGGGS